MNFDNYRSISILPALSKIFEKILHRQIYDFFIENRLLYSSQYGFRKQHSTELATLELIDKIMNQFINHNCYVSVFMDLSKAFDTMNHRILLEKLRYYGFSNFSLDLIDSYLSNRKQFVTFNGVPSELLPINIGVPQGSILGAPPFSHI